MCGETLYGLDEYVKYFIFIAVTYYSSSWNSGIWGGVCCVLFNDGLVFVVMVGMEWNGTGKGCVCDGKKQYREDKTRIQRRTYLVRFLCAEFHIGGMNIAITDSPHSQ